MKDNVRIFSAGPFPRPCNGNSAQHGNGANAPYMRINVRYTCNLSSFSAPSIIVKQIFLDFFSAKLGEGHILYNRLFFGRNNWVCNQVNLFL